MTLQLRVYVPPHPLINHWLGVARDQDTPPTLFRSAMMELGRWLTYEAVRDWLPVIETQVQTPLALSPAKFINPDVPVAVIPILRAGLSLMEGAQALLPLASVYHVGLARDEETLEPSWYLNKLPEQFAPDTRILIPEPMLATGGTSLTVMEALVSRGVQPEHIRFVSVVVAPVALQKLSEAYPALKIFTAAIDETLDDNGFIVPGLGDAGDRTFGTG